MKHKTWADVLRMRRELLDEANPDEETDATQMDHQRRDNIVHTAFLCAASFACVSLSHSQFHRLQFCYIVKEICRDKLTLWQDSPKLGFASCKLAQTGFQTIDDLRKFRGLHWISACGCSAE